MTGGLRRWGRVTLACVAAVLLPGILKVLLRTELSWPLLVALVLLNVLFAVLSTELEGIPARALRSLSTLYTTGFACVVLAGILITPYSAYGIWFETVRDGAPRGVVSTLVVLLAAVFSSALAQRFVYSQIILPLYGELLIAVGLLSLVYQNRLFYILLLCFLAFGSAVLSYRFVQARDRLRNLAAFFLLFLALASASGLFLLSPERRGSRVVDQRLHPGLRQAVVAVFPRFPLLYGIPGFGYGFESKHLGGTPVLSEAPIFDIESRTGASLYLRTAAYTTYDGLSWSRPRGPGADSDRPSAAAAGDRSRIKVLSPGEAPPSSIHITVRVEYYSLVPFTLGTQEIFLPAEQTEGISGSFEEGFQLAAPLRSGQSVYLQHQERLDRSIPAAPILEAGEAAACLQLPARVSPELRELAALLADTAGNSRRTLRNIERYLAEHYTYNLEARRVPAGADFVDTFLFQTREGYCVHFASSFAVLARLNGIPTRYATGFLVTMPQRSYPLEEAPEQGRRTVSGLSAHAWPEVWLEERGWIPWEATTALNPGYYDEIGGDWYFEYRRGENRLTDRQLRAILGRESLLREPAARWSWNLNWRLLFPAIPVSALLAAAVWALRRYGILALAAARPNRRSALRLVAKIVSSRTRGGVERPEKRGWTEWIGTAFRHSSGPGSGTTRLLLVIQRLMYSGRELGKRDLRFLSAFYVKYCLSPVFIPLRSGLRRAGLTRSGLQRAGQRSVRR